MRNHTRRLVRLATVYRGGPRDPRETEYLRWLSSPARAEAVWRFAEDRAHQRRLTTLGMSEATAWRHWYGLGDAERAALARREVEELVAAVWLLGEGAGFAEWLAGEADWPRLDLG